MRRSDGIYINSNRDNIMQYWKCQRCFSQVEGMPGRVIQSVSYGIIIFQREELKLNLAEKVGLAYEDLFYSLSYVTVGEEGSV
jgi:hypothetical protein